MRALSSTLLNAQKSMGAALIKVVLTFTPTVWAVNTAYGVGARVGPTTPNGRCYICTTAGTSHAATEPTWPTTTGDTVTDGTVVWTDNGLTTQTYDNNSTTNLLFEATPVEEEWSQTAILRLDNFDNHFTNLDLKGFKAVISSGYTTSAGDEYSPRAPQWVMSQDLHSWRGYLVCTLSLAGMPNRLGSDKASKEYAHHSTSTKTVKSMLTEVLDGVAVAETLEETQTQVGSKSGTATSTSAFHLVDATSPPFLATDVGRIVKNTTDTTYATITVFNSTSDVTLDNDIMASGEAYTVYATIPLYGGAKIRAGQKLIIWDRTVSHISFKICKVGSPTGDVYFVLHDIYNDTVLARITWGNASALDADIPAWKEVTLVTPIYVEGEAENAEVYLYVEYSDGDASNYVAVSLKDTSVKDNEHLSEFSNSEGWSDLASYDMAYKYKYSSAGIDCFTHCADYGDVVYDSEDSLIDVYLPKDAFKIHLNETRLSAVQRLLGYTGCEIRAEDDAKFHVLVPISGIDAGSTAINRTSFTGLPSSTLIDTHNSANANGIITSVEIWASNNMIGCRVGTFYLVSGTTFKCRDSATIGTVASGSKQTFAVDLIINTGDFIGIYFTSGDIEYGAGGTLMYYKTGEYIDPDDSVAYAAAAAGDTMSLYATGYNYEYSLEDGEHPFFSKAKRKGIIIPNHVTVQSFPDDVDQYSGVATNAESYALMPHKEFREMKLNSDAQAASIAAAIISSAQVAMQQGSASVPVNVGAEVFDYVKVIDSRQGDTKVGNIGSLRCPYKLGSFNLDFTLGSIPLKGVGGTRLSLWHYEDVVRENQNVTWGGLDPTIDKIEWDLEVLDKGGKAILFLLDDVDARIDWLEGETSNPESLAAQYYSKPQIDASLLKYLTLIGGTMSGAIAMGTKKITGMGDPTAAQDAATKAYADTKLANVVEDTTPQLGGDLALNGHNIDFPTTANISDCLDEDNMASDSATKLATQQSIKAYVDDKLDDATQQDGSTVAYVSPSGSRAVDSTVYQNTSGKIRMITISCVVNDAEWFAILTGATSSSATVVAYQSVGGTGGACRLSGTAVIPPSWYYKVNVAGTPALEAWIEWDLH